MYVLQPDSLNEQEGLWSNDCEHSKDGKFGIAWTTSVVAKEKFLSHKLWQKTFVGGW